MWREAVTTDVARAQKILAYDGDCPMCIGSVGVLLKFGLVRPEQTQSNHDLAPADQALAEAAGIRNQLIVLDPDSREWRGGADGLLWIIGDNFGNPGWVRMLRLPGVRQLVRFCYEAVSYNRRIISPPRHRIRCDCEPQATFARRMTLVGPLALIGLLPTMLCGAAVFAGGGLGSPLLGAAVLLAAVSGWLVVGAAAIVALGGEQRIDYLAHLVVMAFAGSLALIPAGLVGWWLPRQAGLALTLVSLLAGFVLMFAMQRRRLAAVGLSDRWRWGWAGAVVLGAVVTFAVTAAYV
jgi:predicted DCC family thiol-disulfide oxidoreductase YuxK